MIKKIKELVNTVLEMVFTPWKYVEHIDKEEIVVRVHSDKCIVIYPYEDSYILDPLNMTEEEVQDVLDMEWVDIDEGKD